MSEAKEKPALTEQELTDFLEKMLKKCDKEIARKKKKENRKPR